MADQQISHGMPQRVIDRFELVEIQEQDPQAVPVRNRIKKAVHFIPVRQSGDRVAISHAFENEAVQEYRRPGNKQDDEDDHGNSVQQ
ncbi:hypothetical protein D1872_282230 [compost metagenome]